MKAPSLLLCIALTIAPTLFFGLSTAHAALSEEEPILQPRPLDRVREEIVKKHKSKRARALKKAWDAFQAKKFAQAIQLANASSKDPLFGDYGFWISASASYSSALKALAAGKNTEAIKAAETSIAQSFKIDERFPFSPLIKNIARDIGLSEVLQGDAYVGARKWATAETAYERGFQRLATNGSLGLVRPESLQRYAKACNEDEGDFCEAWVQRFLVYYPRNSEELRAVLKIFPSAGERPHAAGNPKLTQTYKAPDLDQASFDQNLALYLDGKFGAAIKGFQQFADEFPKSAYRFRARYWLAQALTHEQDHEKARKTYESVQHDSPLTYYGLLASIANGRDFNATIENSEPLAIERDPMLQPHETVRLTRSEEFLAEDARELAAMELKEFRSRDALSSHFLMYLAALNFQAHTFSTAFSILGDLIGRGYESIASAPVLRMIFPIEHWDTINKYATDLGLDPILLLSLIKQESAFDTSAISSSGALGLMQLMPGTASDTDPSVQRADLVLADTNIRVGAKYLAHLLKRFNGNIALALAGYNAGPGAVDRWLRDAGGKRGMLEFIESIPYKETREYVGAIVRNYYWYSRLRSPAETPKQLTYFWGVQGAAPSPKPSLALSATPDSRTSLAPASPIPSPSASLPDK